MHNDNDCNKDHNLIYKELIIGGLVWVRVIGSTITPSKHTWKKMVACGSGLKFAVFECIVGNANAYDTSVS